MFPHAYVTKTTRVYSIYSIVETMKHGPSSFM